MKKTVSIAFVLGLLLLPLTTIHAKETANIYQTIGKRFVGGIERIKLSAFEKQLFPNLKDDDIVFQVNDGGFLYCGKQDPKACKIEFEAANQGTKLTQMSVAQAKEIYVAKLASYYSKNL